MKIPAYLERFLGNKPDQKNPAPHQSPLPDRQIFQPQLFGKSAILLALPILFLLGGSLCLIVFASYVLGSPIKIDSTALNQRSAFSAAPPGEAVLGESVVRQEARPLILRKFLESYNSPLAEYAGVLVEAADRYDLDWRLLPAIAGQESTFCRTIPEESHNCWGWAIHESYTKKFETWEGAIETVAEGLKTDYIDRGLVTPEEIMTRYCPRSITERDGSWARAVEYFIWALENF